GFVDVGHRRLADDAGHVGHDVEAPEGGDGVLDEGVDLVATGDVDVALLGSPAGTRDRRHRVAPAVVVDVGHDDLGPGRSQRDRRGLSDAAAGAGDDGAPAGEIEPGDQVGVHRSSPWMALVTVRVAAMSRSAYWGTCSAESWSRKPMSVSASTTSPSGPKTGAAMWFTRYDADGPSSISAYSSWARASTSSPSTARASRSWSAVSSASTRPSRARASA